MKNPASYQVSERDTDWAQDIALLDWDHGLDKALTQAAALLNEALSEEYGNVAEFQTKLWGHGFAQSVAAGTFMRETLEHTPEQFQPDIIATALDQVGADHHAIVLAYRRDYNDLDKMHWPEPDASQDNILEQVAGPEVYREILLARETLKQSAYICATPGEFGPKDETHFLDSVRDGYQATLYHDGVTPEQVLESIDLAYRRIAYVSRRHLDSFLDHLHPDHPATEVVEHLVASLDQAGTHSGAQTLYHTAAALSHAIAADDTIPTSESHRFNELVRLAQECHQASDQRAPEQQTTMYQHLEPSESIEKMSYETIERLRYMGYRNELELVNTIASDDWNQVCRGLQDLDTAIQNPPAAYAVARQITSMTEKSAASDTALTRFQHLEYIMAATENNGAYTAEAAIAMETLQDAGAPELAVKLDEMLQHSSNVNLLRLAPTTKFFNHSRSSLSERHLQYNDLVANLPEIVSAQGMIPTRDEDLTYLDRAQHEVHRMGFRLMSEIHQRLLEQYRPNGILVEAAERRGMDDAVTDRIREYQNNEQVTADQAATWTLNPDNIQWLVNLTTVKLAMQHAVDTYSSTELLQLLDRFENRWDNAEVHDQATEMLHPIIQGALAAAKDIAAEWTQEQLDDGQVGYPVRYADLQYHETDGGREQWRQQPGPGNGRDEVAGDCTVRSLAAAIGRTDAYGEIWDAFTESMQDVDSERTDADNGSKPSEFHEIFAAYGVINVYTDSQLPMGFARREIDLREVPVALSHLFDDSGKPLIYIVSTVNHNVAVVNHALNDHADTRFIGDDENDGQQGRIAQLWVMSDDPNTIESTRAAFDQYARVRAYSAA